jgi:prepilin-type N-terminal cleavage/methylation domain-containing protein
MKKMKGFTLIELLVVVIIIGILAAIALPKYNYFATKTKLTNILQQYGSLNTAVKLYWLTNEKIPNSFDLLDTTFPNCDIKTETQYAGGPNINCKIRGIDFVFRIMPNRTQVLLGVGHISSWNSYMHIETPFSTWKPYCHAQYVSGAGQENAKKFCLDSGLEVK